MWLGIERNLYVIQGKRIPVFPAMNEKCFSVLYSNKAFRTYTPVNMTVGALIIKELFDHSDDEMVENLTLDFQIQYVLQTTSFEEQLLCESDYNDSTEYDLFVRCLSEQAIVENEKRRLRTNEDSGMKSTMMQRDEQEEMTAIVAEGA